MEWLVENWVIVLLLGGMAAMHLFGHSHGHGHGGHKHGGKSNKQKSARDEKPDADTSAPSEDA